MRYKNKHWISRYVQTPVVKALEEVLHFVIEPQAQFYPAFYKLRTTRQKRSFWSRTRRLTGIANSSTILSIRKSFESVLHLNVTGFDVSLSFVAHLRRGFRWGGGGGEGSLKKGRKR